MDTPRRTWTTTRKGPIRRLAVGLVFAAALLLDAGGAAAAIIANLETPNSKELASGIGNVQGWAFSTVPGDEIEPLVDVVIDGQPALQVPCCSPRGDVEQDYPKAPALSGFAGVYNFQSLTPGSHTVEVHVYSKLGEHKVLSTTFESESLGSFSFNKGFSFDDAKADHCTPSNVLVDGTKVARLACTGFRMTNAKGFTEHCAGTVELTWMVSSQGFRVTKGCDLIDWTMPPIVINPDFLEGK